MLDYSDTISGIRRMGDTVEEYYEVAAAGGSALVSYNIKSQTRDVDYIVETGHAFDFKEKYQKIVGGEIDVSFSGLCFKVRLPDNYLDLCVDFGTFGNVRLQALGIADVIITKTSRFNDRDKNNLDLCRSHIGFDDVAKRIHDYKLHPNYMNNIKRGIKEVFGYDI